MVNILLIVNNDYCDKVDIETNKIDDEFLNTEIENNNLIIFTHDSTPKYKDGNTNCRSGYECPNRVV